MAEIRSEDMGLGEKNAPERERLAPRIDPSKIVSTKKGVGDKFVEAFIKEDLRDVKDYVVKEKVIPFIKKLFLDGMSMIFFGESYDRDRRDSGYGRASYKDYSAQYRSSDGDRDRRHNDDYRREKRDQKYDPCHIVLSDKRSAEDLIYDMKERIRDRGEISVAEFFDMLKIPGDYTDNNWGWTHPDDIRLKRVYDGFLIDVPQPRNLG